MPVGAFTQPLKERVGHGHVPTFAEDRFDEDRRGVIGRGHGRELVIELTQCVGDRVGLRHPQAVGEGERGHHDPGDEGTDARTDLGAGRGQRRGAHGPSVEGTLEHDRVLTPGGLTGQAQCGLHGLTAGVDVEQPVEAFGKNLAESLGES